MSRPVGEDGLISDDVRRYMDEQKTHEKLVLRVGKMLWKHAEERWVPSSKTCGTMPHCAILPFDYAMVLNRVTCHR